MLRRDIIKKPVLSTPCELSIIKTNTELSKLGERRRLSKDKSNQAISESKVSNLTLGLREPPDEGLTRTVARINKTFNQSAKLNRIKSSKRVRH